MRAPATTRPAPGASPAQTGDAPLVLEGIVKRFGSQQVLHGVSLTLAPGEFVALLGANGCGKSTLLRCAIRLLDPDGGSAHLRGRDLATLRGRELRLARREAAVVFQQIALVKRRTTLDNVCCGALGRLPLTRSITPGLFPAEVRERAAYALARVGMLEHAWQSAGTLSGGQAQRVAIARALCQQASVLLADEPVSALDPRAADDVLGILADIARRDGLSVLAVLHQPELALRYADRVVGMKLGRVVFEKPAAAVTSEDVEGLYDRLHEA